MEHWGIYVAYAWMATIVLGITDAVRAIRKGPQPRLQPGEASPPKDEPVG